MLSAKKNLSEDAILWLLISWKQLSRDATHFQKDVPACILLEEEYAEKMKTFTDLEVAANKIKCESI